ncbi:MAG: sugar phosphate nucleotidyltransferase [Clostridia bacterium]|nr:sugar phosphate nucleotidyltransferase [Clostridia bacterium]
MKCLILAGGTGDTLWPLSRKNYPKQFMNIKEGRSLLQETIVRNMTFCDEFIIITNESYLNIVEGQMKAFQGLRYRVILEGQPRGTAPAIALGCTFCNQSELVFVVSADNLIEGKEYQNAILEAKEMAKTGALVAFGVKPYKPSSSYGYIRHDKTCITRFVEKASLEEAADFTYENGYLWNSGLFVFRAGDFLNALNKYNPQMYACCFDARKKVPAIRRVINFPDFIMEDFPSGSVEGSVFAKTDKARVIEIKFKWQDVGNVTDLAVIDGVADIGNRYVIENGCKNVDVINKAQKNLVVTNDLEDIVVVNTDDAVYVSKKDSVENIKEIIHENHEKYEHYFDYNRLSYREWGIHELLTSAKGYKVKKVTVFPGMSMNLHQHEFRSEHWSVVEGVATITLGADERDYHKFESVFVPVGMQHKVANHTDKNVVIIEVGIGDMLTDNDMVKIYGQENEQSGPVSDIVKLDPAFKDNLWGGTKLRTVFGKKCDYDIIAESWELSAHPDGQSRIAEGRYRGMLFNEYLRRIGKEALGWKCQALDRFPILIKFIDAKQALSVQIHPDDEYALEVEGEYGKNEVWYVLDCEPGASLYCGLSRKTSKEEIKQRIANNTITEILNEVKVKKGDVVFIKAGTIHAIGAGILICEIQQNSNSTYRLYDYDRRDKYGNLRELHLEKALDVVDVEPYVRNNDKPELLQSDENFDVERLVQCKYFECFKYVVRKEAKIMVDEASFVSVLFLSGCGSITVDKRTLEFKAGESFFVTAGKKNIIIHGESECIVTHV